MAVVTSDNPRSEDPAAIISAVLSGVPAGAPTRLLVEPDRRTAIALAFEAAADGDVVLIAGKGHETTQTIGDRVLPFDDRAVARQLLEGQMREGQMRDGQMRDGGAGPVTALFIAGAMAMVISLIATRFTIRIFGRIGRGQPILGKEDRGPEHQHKAGTPTMGGIAILGSAVLAYLLTHLREGVVFSDQVLIMIVGITALAFLGFLDDFVKVRRARNRGIFWKTKGWLVLGVSAAIALWLGLATNVKTTLSFTRWDYPGWELPLWLWVIWATVIIFATTHAVNVTDGLDGLAAGTSLFGFIAFTVIAFWGFRNPDIYEIVNPLDLAVLAVALAGACAGFLWWNAAPARIFMGDVGALGIGASLGMLAVTSNTQLLLPIIAGLQVMEIGSVALQMGTYRLSGRTRRLFKIAPVHHHFELIGWPETTVIIRFWVISGICVAAALALYYADWLTAAGLR